MEDSYCIGKRTEVHKSWDAWISRQVQVLKSYRQSRYSNKIAVFLIFSQFTILHVCGCFYGCTLNIKW